MENSILDIIKKIVDDCDREIEYLQKLKISRVEKIKKFESSLNKKGFYLKLDNEDVMIGNVTVSSLNKVLSICDKSGFDIDIYCDGYKYWYGSEQHVKDFELSPDKSLEARVILEPDMD